MKANLKKELHNKSVSELRKQVVDSIEELRVLQLDKEMGKLTNTSLLGAKKDEIAVLKTILNEKLVAEKVEQIAKVEDKKEKTVTRKAASVKTTATKGGKNE